MKENMTKEEMTYFAKKFMNTYAADKNSRFRSYDYARKVFLENIKTKDEETIDLIALNLFAYLGSWGMICRGNFLMQKDYKFLIPIVKTLLEYKDLCDMDPLAEKFRDEYVKSTMDAVEAVRAHFKGVKYYIMDKKLTNKKATDAVIGKILMATLGCLPAYDTYVMKALKKEGLGGTLNGNSVGKLVDFCLNHKKELEEISARVNKDREIKYPVMKILDMIFWEYGQTLE